MHIFPGEGPLECSSCPPHSMLENGMCMACLGAQYYDTFTQLCRSCHIKCHRCTGPGEFSCSGCAPPLHLDRLNNQCVPCCKAEEDLDKTNECCICDSEIGMSLSTLNTFFVTHTRFSRVYMPLHRDGSDVFPNGKHRLPQMRKFYFEKFEVVYMFLRFEIFFKFWTFFWNWKLLKIWKKCWQFRKISKNFLKCRIEKKITSRPVLEA